MFYFPYSISEIITIMMIIMMMMMITVIMIVIITMYIWKRVRDKVIKKTLIFFNPFFFLSQTRSGEKYIKLNSPGVALKKNDNN